MDLVPLKKKQSYARQMFRGLKPHFEHVRNVKTG